MDTDDNRPNHQSRVKGQGGPHPEPPDAGPADRQQTIDQLRQNIRRMTARDRDRTGAYFDQLSNTDRIPSLRLFQDDDSDSDITQQH